MSLVNVLVQVFPCLYGTTYLHVYVTFVFCKEIWIVWDNPAVIKYMIPCPYCSAIVAAAVDRVGIIYNWCFLCKFLWVIFCADIIFQAPFFWTWTMKHVFHYSIIQIRLQSLVWYFSSYNTIDFLSSTGVVSVSKKKKNVGFWNSTTCTFAKCLPSTPFTVMSSLIAFNLIAWLLTTSFARYLSFNDQPVSSTYWKKLQPSWSYSGTYLEEEILSL